MKKILFFLMFILLSSLAFADFKDEYNITYTVTFDNLTGDLNYTKGDASFTTGLIDNALSFSGSANDNAYTSNESWDGTNGFSFSTWFRPTGLGGDSRHIFLVTSGTDSAQCFIREPSGNKLRCAYVADSGTTVSIDSNNAMTVNNLYHIFFIKSGGSVNLYINNTVQTGGSGASGTWDIP